MKATLKSSRLRRSFRQGARVAKSPLVAIRSSKVILPKRIVSDVVDVIDVYTEVNPGDGLVSLYAPDGNYYQLQIHVEQVGDEPIGFLAVHQTPADEGLFGAEYVLLLAPNGNTYRFSLTLDGTEIRASVSQTRVIPAVGQTALQLQRIDTGDLGQLVLILDGNLVTYQVQI